MESTLSNHVTRTMFENIMNFDENEYLEYARKHLKIYDHLIKRSSIGWEFGGAPSVAGRFITTVPIGSKEIEYFQEKWKSENPDTEQTFIKLFEDTVVSAALAMRQEQITGRLISKLEEIGICFNGDVDQALEFWNTRISVSQELKTCDVYFLDHGTESQKLLLLANNMLNVSYDEDIKVSIG